MAPQVQSLSDILASLNPVYNPQRQTIQNDIGTIQQNASAQQSALDAAKTQGFQGIQNQANARGMLFSGFTPYEQAQYLSTKYLPAVAQLNNNTNEAISKSQNNLTQLDAQQNKDANDTLAGQQKAYSDWYNQQQQLAQQLAIAQMNNQAKLQAAQIGASSRASAAAAKAPSAAQIKQQDLSTVAQALGSKVGKDGHVSQQTWNAAQTAWLNAGYSAADFNKTFIQYVNQRYKGYHGYN